MLVIEIENKNSPAAISKIYYIERKKIRIPRRPYLNKAIYRDRSTRIRIRSDHIETMLFMEKETLEFDYSTVILKLGYYFRDIETLEFNSPGAILK